MKNMMSMAEIEQLMQLEVAVPLAVGIAMLLYTCFFLFTYKEKGAGKAKKSKSKATPAGKPTRRSVRESKAPKVWGEDDDEDPKVSCRGGEFASKLSLS